MPSTSGKAAWWSSISSAISARIASWSSRVIDTAVRRHLVRPPSAVATGAGTAPAVVLCSSRPTPGMVAGRLARAQRRCRPCSAAASLRTSLPNAPRAARRSAPGPAQDRHQQAQRTAQGAGGRGRPHQPIAAAGWTGRQVEQHRACSDALRPTSGWLRTASSVETRR